MPPLSLCCWEVGSNYTQDLTLIQVVFSPCEHFPWNDAITPMVHSTSTLDSKGISGNYQLTTFLHVLVSMKSQSYMRSYTEKSFHLLLKRTDWIAFKFKFKGIKMYTGEWRRWEVIDFNFLTRKLTENRFSNLQWIKRENIRP